MQIQGIVHRETDMMIRSIIIVLILGTPLLHAEESKNRIGLNYQYFKNDINNVSATPNTFSIEFARALHPRVAAVGSIVLSSSDGSASESISVNLNTTTFDYTTSIDSEMQLSAEIYLFDQYEANFNPYFNLGISTIETEFQIDATQNGNLSSSTVSTSDSSGIVYGAGFMYKFLEAWGLKAEYIDIAHDDTNATKFSFGIHRKF